MTDTLTQAPEFVVVDQDNERMTLPQFCFAYLHLPANDPLRRRFARAIDAKCSRIETRGGEIDYPLRMTRYGWYVEWNAFEHDDGTEDDARYAGCW